MLLVAHHCSPCVHGCFIQVIGSVRLETTRVTSSSCAYKHSAWSKIILAFRRPTLAAAETRHPACYGPREFGIADEPFGPWQDPTKWSSELHGAEPRYVVDLGKDPTFAKKKLEELRKEQFLSLYTRRATISLTVYNK